MFALKTGTLPPMSAVEAALVMAACAVGAHFLLCAAPHVLTRAHLDGDPKAGLVIFVEPIRWLSVPWGLRQATSGLRRAGFAGEVLHWKWHSWWRGWLVLPALMHRAFLEERAGRLAAFIASERADHPDRPIYLVGYSCGGFLTVRALELLPEGVTVNAAAVLAGAMSPKRDLTDACAHVDGTMVVTSSLGDWLIVGLGTLVFGTADRVHALSMGMVGPAREPPRRLVHLPWRMSMLSLWHLGGHFSAVAPRFIATFVAPAMGIAPTAD